MNSFFGQYGCVCFEWKSLSEMFFQKWWCLVGSKNRIFWKLISIDPNKMALTTEIILHFHFYFKVLSEKERERERVCDRWWPSSSPVRQSPANPELQSVSISQAPVRRPRSARCYARSWLTLREIVVDRDLVTSIAISRRSRSRLREFAPSIKGEIAIDGAIVGLELAKHRAAEPSRASIVDNFFFGFCPCFAGFVFSFFFSKH